MRQRVAPQAPNAAPAPRWLIPVACTLLVLMTVAVYSPVLGHPFINYDDGDYVFENSHVQAGVTWQTISWAMTTPAAANWHPLTWLSHALDCQFFGLNPTGHHLTSVLLHIANAILLFLALARVTGAVGRSFLVAAFVALHPLNVESVAWIAERKNVLSMLFFLLALVAYGWYVLRPHWRRYAALAILFAMSLASKPMGITLPFVLILLDYWPLRRIKGWITPSQTFPVPQQSWQRLAVEKLPLLLLSLASAMVTIFVQSAGHAVRPLGDLPLRVRLENAIYSCALYLGKIFWPAKLALMYPHPLDTLTFVQIGFSLLTLAALTGVAWALRAKCPYFLTGWLWFLGTLFPVVGIVQVGTQGMADRYTYLPAIGIFLIAVWGAADLLRVRLAPLWVSIAIAAIIFTALSALTVRQLSYWASSMDLWTHTLEVTENNFIANDQMGFLLLRQGRPEALQYFQTAAQISPTDPLSHGAVASSLLDQGRLPEAIREYDIALRMEENPMFRAHIYANLGLIHRLLAEDDQARDDFRLALRLDPAEVHKMIQQLADMVAARPAAAGYFRLGLLLEGANQSAQARSSYEKALSLDPQFAPARAALEALPAAH